MTRVVCTEGFYTDIAHKPTCDCGEKSFYSDWASGYDAYYCVVCNKWLNPGCGDPNCEFCKDRPEKPIVLQPRCDYTQSKHGCQGLLDN